MAGRSEWSIYISTMNSHHIRRKRDEKKWRRGRSKNKSSISKGGHNGIGCLLLVVHTRSCKPMHLHGICIRAVCSASPLTPMWLAPSARSSRVSSVREIRSWGKKKKNFFFFFPSLLYIYCTRTHNFGFLHSMCQLQTVATDTETGRVLYFQYDFTPKCFHFLFISPVLEL